MMVRRMVWLGLLLCGGAAARGFNVPPRPADRFFIQDYAGVLPDEARQRIGVVQRVAFEDHDTPIIVVTIDAMSRYGYAGAIEPFAHDWFNAWGIGKQTTNGLSDRGMLVLVSVQDRKARIELGREWGRLADATCQAIIQQRMVPAFRAGRYAEGIEAGVRRLAEVAAAGPLSMQGVERDPAAAVQGLVDRLPGRDLKVSTSPLPGNYLFLGTIIGGALLLLSIFFPGLRRVLLKLAIGILLLTWLTWFVFFLLGLFGRSSGSRSGGGYSGGGFAGGSSGGGGASGSW